MEGGEIDESNLEKELEVQREKDAIEGRKRGKSRSPPKQRQRSRSHQEQDEDDDRYNPYASGVRRNPGRANRNHVNYEIDVMDHDIFPNQQDANMFYGQEMQQPFHDGQSYQDGFGQNYYYGQDTALPIDYDLGQRGNPAPLSFDHAGNVSLDYLPATPRTFAMQQHSQHIQDRMRNADGSHRSPTQGQMNLPVNLLSPMKDAFGTSLNRSFDHFLPQTAYGAPPTSYYSSDNRASSLDTGALLPPISPRSMSAPQNTGLWNQNNMFDQHDQHIPTNLNRLLNESSSAPAPFSAFGEMAATSHQGMPTYGHEIALEPSQEVQYVYLSREQARDSRLVEEIRSQSVLLLLLIQGVVLMGYAGASVLLSMLLRTIYLYTRILACFRFRCKQDIGLRVRCI